MRWLRLFAVPMAAWLSALGLVGASVRTGLLTALLAALVAAAMAWSWHLGRHRSRDALLLIVAVAIAAVGASSAARSSALTGEPWSVWGENRTEVSVVLTLTQTPRLQVSDRWAGASATTTQSARAVVTEVADDTSVWNTDTKVFVSVSGGIVSEPLRRGDQIIGTARVGKGEQRTGLAARLTVVEAVTVIPAGGPVGAVDRNFRRSLAGVDSDRAALVQGLALGEDAALGDEARESIRVAGLAHLTAVSGANIAIVVGVVMWAARVAGLSRTIAVAPAAAVMAVYVWLVGPEPSVVRAAAMATVVLTAVVLGGGSGAAALSSAITVLLVWDPGLSVSRGFALSCAATAGLIAAAPTGHRLLIRLLARTPGWARVPTTVVAAAFVAALAAGMATAPLLASYGEGVSWAAIVANVLVAPIVPLVTVGGLAVAGLGLLSTPLGALVATVPSWGAAWIIGVARWAQELPGGRVLLPGTWQVGVAVAAAVTVALVVGRRWPRAPLLIALAAVVAAVAHATMPAVRPGAPNEWSVLFCDVGQGDVTLLRSGPDAVVLVDAGPEPRAAVDCIQRAGVRRVDAALLSHFHRDHVDGFGEFARRYSPEQVWVSPLADPRPQAAEVDTAARSTGTLVLSPAPGTHASWGDVQVEVLAPLRTITSGSAANNASLVVIADVRTAHGDLRVLLAGDVEPEAQAALMSAVSDPQVTVAKVPHHGSANQHPRFAAWAKARWAVISCGRDNDYGHPAASTMRTWQDTGAAVLRTDDHGDIFIVATEGSQVLAFTARAPTPVQRLPGDG